MNYGKISNFKKDRNIESKLTQFLNENYYAYISSDYWTFGVNYNDLTAQYAGIDLSVGNMLIDQKSKNTNSPNEIKDYFASVEIIQKDIAGNYVKGWLISNKTKTTHYDFLYRFEDNDNDISSVIQVRFSRFDMLRYLNSIEPLKNLAKSAYQLKDGIRGIDYKRYQKWDNRIKLTKTIEDAIVATFRLSDLIRNRKDYFKSLELVRITKDGYDKISDQEFLTLLGEK